MCQLLGMNCNTPTDVTFSFSGFAQRGGRTDHHADGWGIAFFEERGLRHFVDHQPACESPRCKESKSHRRVEMSTGDVAEGIDHREDDQAESQGNADMRNRPV